MDKLACCVVSAYDLMFMCRAFARNVGARVWEAAQGTCGGGGLPITEGQLTVVEVAMDKLEQGSTLFWG